MPELSGISSQEGAQVVWFERQWVYTSIVEEISCDLGTWEEPALL